MSSDKENEKSTTEKVQDVANTAQDVENITKDGVNLAKDLYTGNYAGAAKDAVNLLKNKKVRRHLIITWSINIIVPILTLVLLAGLFMAVVSSIGDIVTDIVSTMGEFFSGIGNWFISLFDEESGKYIITIDETKFEELKASLASQGINAEDSSLTDECLKLFILAQYKTQYPEDVVIKIEVSADEKLKIENRNIGRTSKIDIETINEDGVDKYYIKTSGCIQLYRPEFNDSDKKLKYATEEDLQAYKDGTKSWDDVKDKYTIDSSGNLIVPTKKTEEVYKGINQVQESGMLLDFSREEGNDVWENFRKDGNTTKETKETPDLSSPIPYQSKISSYAMPFEFLTILTTFTQDSEYGVAVAQLVISDNTSIELNILDNSQTNEERYIQQYHSNTNAKFKVGAKAYLPIYSALWGGYTGNISDYYVYDREWVWRSDTSTYSTQYEYNYATKTPRIYRENIITTEYTPSIELIKAETWFASKENSYTVEETESQLDGDPKIANPPAEAPFEFNINDQSTYDGLENLYNTDATFQKFINDYYNKDTGKNGYNDFKEDLINIYENWLKGSFGNDINYKDDLLSHINGFVEYQLFYKFYRFEIASDPNVVPLNFMDKIYELLPTDETITNQYNNIVAAKDDYVAESTFTKIGAYDVMPFEITNTKTEHQIKKSYYVSEKKYNVTQGTATDNTDEFLKLLKDNNKYVEYKTVYGTDKPGADLASAPDMLFEILANNSKTANLENAMRYIMYKMTNKDYGVTDFNSAYRAMNTRRVGSDYSVTDDTIFIKDKNKLIEAIESLPLPAQAKLNLKNNADAFLDMQEQYNVNAALAISVAVAESTAGTNWAAIDPNTYNWMSISGTYNGQSIGNWRKYPSFREATLDFGELIAGSIYCGSGNTRISEIGNIYCPNTAEYPTQADTWISNTQAYMTKILSAGGVDLSSYTGGDASGVVEFARQYVGKGIYEVLPLGEAPSDGAFTSYWGADWCAMFVSYCFDSCGLIPSVLEHSYAGCTGATQHWIGEGKMKPKESYTPKAGDIIFFGTESSRYHTGIVTDCDGTYVYTIEGNTGGGWSVSIVTETGYPINDGRIYGYYET